MPLIRRNSIESRATLVGSCSITSGFQLSNSPHSTHRYRFLAFQNLVRLIVSLMYLGFGVVALAQTQPAQNLPTVGYTVWGNSELLDPVLACNTDFAQQHPGYSGDFDEVIGYTCVSNDGDDLSGWSYEFYLAKSCHYSNGESSPGECQIALPQCETVGNPTGIVNGEKIETVVDWTSPKDRRFKVERFYRSDNSFALINQMSSVDISAHAGIWQQGWDEGIFRQTFFGSHNIIYVRSDGKRFEFDGTTYAELAGGNEYVLSYDDIADEYTIRDYSGTKAVYKTGSSSGYLLSDRYWSDGYHLQISRDSSGRVGSVKDNRNQFASFVWTTVNYTGADADVVTKISFDTNYNGTSLQPEISIDYQYGGNTVIAGPNPPWLTSVNLIDEGTSATHLTAQYSYDATGNAFPPPITKIYDGRLDAAGQPFPFATFSYNVGWGLWGQTAQSTHPAGTANFLFARWQDQTTLENKVTTTNPLGKQTTYTFVDVDGVSRIGRIDGIATTSCLGTAKTFDYTPVASGPSGFVYSQIERNGSKTTFTRDTRGLILTRTEDATSAAPRITTYTWDPVLPLPLTITTSQKQTINTYDGDGLLLTRTEKDVLLGSPSNGQTRIWTYTYSALASGQKVLVSMDGPGLVANGINDVTTYSYDAEGKLLTATDPNGLVTTILSYNSMGQPTLVRDPDEMQWAFTYDFRGRIASTRYGLVAATSPATNFSYDVIGQLLSYTDVRGKTWAYSYDTARRLTVATSPSGDKATYAYDAMDNVLRTEYSNGSSAATFWEDSQFDELGRILKTIGAIGQTWTYAHDVEDNLHVQTDPANLSTITNYDALNRVISVVDRQNYTTNLKHSNDDLLTEFKDPRALTTTFSYNGFGEVISEASPDRGATTYVYDSRGLITSRTNALGTTINYVYDNGSRLKIIDYPTGTLADINFLYDVDRLSATYKQNRGYLGAVQRSGETVDFKYDQSLGRNPNYVKYYYSGNRQYLLNYTYDALGNVLTITYPNSGTIVKYSYDDDNRVTQVAVRLAGAGSDTILANQITYVPNGPLASLHFGDGSVETRTYDNSYRLTGLTDVNGTTTLRILSYGYNAHDNLTSISDLLSAANNQTFTYSPRELLATAVGPFANLAYTYDGVGNRLTQSVGAATESYAYPGSSNRLSSITSASTPARTLTHNAIGNVTTDNRGGNIYTYVYDAADRIRQVKLNGVIQANYTYNYRGQQITRGFPASGLIIHSVFGLDGNRISEHNQTTGALIREYVWLGGSPLAVIEGGQIYLIRTDHIGRPAFATTMAGTQVWSASYLPFGGVHTSVGTPIDLRFPGQWFQTETGLYQNWMRDYDPTTGRYMEADPLGLIDGASVYGYAQQNPNGWIDPIGQQAISLPSPGGLGGPLVPLAVAPGTPLGNALSESLNENLPSLIDEINKYNPMVPVVNACAEGICLVTGYCVASQEEADESEHDKNKRPSTKEKHEKGQKRKITDQGGEKGDKRRPYKRK